MLADIAVVLAFAVIGIVVVYVLFARLSFVPVEASKAKVPKDKAPSPQHSLTKAQKMKLKQKQEEEAALDALVAREALSTKGMPSTRFGVETLEERREKLRQAAASKSAVTEKELSADYTEEDRVKDRAAGFKLVTKEKEVKPSSPTVPSSKQTSAVSSQAELDKKLAAFFKMSGGSNKRRNDDYTTRPNGSPKPTTAANTNVRVDVKKTITAAKEDAWESHGGDRQQW